MNSSENKTSTEFEVNSMMAYTMAIEIPFIVIGNLLVLIAVFGFKHMRTTTNILVAALALNDFLIGSVSVPMMIYIYLIVLRLPGNSGEFFNWMWVIPNIFSILAILFVLLITIERFVAIVYPMKLKLIFTRTKLTIYIICIVVITTAWCMMLGIGYIWGYNLITDVPYNYITIYLFYIFPLIMIVVLYGATLQKLRFYKKESMLNNTGHKQGNTSKDKLNKAELKLTISLSIVIIFLILAYVPNAIWWSMSYFIFSVEMNIFSMVTNILQVIHLL